MLATHHHQNHRVSFPAGKAISQIKVRQNKKNVEKVARVTYLWRDFFGQKEQISGEHFYRRKENAEIFRW